MKPKVWIPIAVIVIVVVVFFTARSGRDRGPDGVSGTDRSPESEVLGTTLADLERVTDGEETELYSLAEARSSELKTFDDSFDETEAAVPAL